MSSCIIFCIQICFIQYVFSQRVNGPATVNNGPNAGLGSPLQGQALGRISSELGGVINALGIAPIPNQVLGPYGQTMPNGQAYIGAGNAGIPNKFLNGVGMPNKYNGAGMPNQAYGGSGNGDVAVNGELSVAGMTTVTGHVPLTGKVAFNGNVPCSGIVTITGGCKSCGVNAPYGQTPTFGNKPYGY